MGHLASQCGRPPSLTTQERRPRLRGLSLRFLTCRLSPRGLIYCCRKAMLCFLLEWTCRHSGSKAQPLLSAECRQRALDSDHAIVSLRDESLARGSGDCTELPVFQQRPCFTWADTAREDSYQSQAPDDSRNYPKPQSLSKSFRPKFRTPEPPSPRS